MHVITYSVLRNFSIKYPNSKTSLDAWYKIVNKTDFSSFNKLREIFPSADVVKNAKGNNLTVFNIHGNEVRLIVDIHYNTKKVYIRNILTHVEYDQERWKY